MRRLISGLVFVLLFSGNSYAETSTSLVREQATSQYIAMKQAMEQLYRQNINAFAFNYLSEGILQLDSCQDPRSFLGTDREGAEEAWFTQLAYQVVYVSANMTRLNYPENVWQPALDDFESRSLAAGGKLSDVAFKELISKLLVKTRAYRKAHPATAEIQAGGECGDGEVSVNIATAPRGARVYVIPKLFYLFCQTQGIDPEDTKQCDRWHEVIDGKVEYVNGNYQYFARWPDGKDRRGVLSVGVNDSGSVIVLRAPN